MIASFSATALLLEMNRLQDPLEEFVALPGTAMSRRDCLIC